MTYKGLHRAKVVQEATIGHQTYDPTQDPGDEPETMTPTQDEEILEAVSA